LATGSTDKKVRRRAMPIAFSSDRRLLAVGGVDDSVRLQVTATGRTQQVLEGHTGELLSVVFSPDGRLLASSSTDRTVRVWNTATGSLLGTIHALIFGSLAFSPDGRQLVSKHRYHPVRFWDVTTGAPQKDPKSNSSGFGSITFSPDRQLLAPGSGTRLLRLLDTSTGDLQEFSGSLYPVTSVSFSPDGRLLASGSADMTVRVWDIITGTLQWSSEGHSEIVVSVAYSPDGRLLASGSRDGTILVWDTAKSTLRHTLTAAGSVWSVTHLDFGEDSSTLRTRLQSFNLQARHVNCTPNSLPVTLNISPQSQWIMLNGANSLWLPYGYRCVAIHERMLALLHSSGRLSFILVRE
jgi:WD40 repeat protein